MASSFNYLYIFKISGMKNDKFLLYLVPFVIILLHSCNKDKDEFNISGVIESYSNISGQEIRLCSRPNSIVDIDMSTIFGASNINNAGSFNIENISSPSNAHLVTLDSIFGKNILLSDVSVKGCRASLYVYNNNSHLYVGNAAKCNAEILYAPGSFIVKYIYVNNEVTITGVGVRKYTMGLISIKDTINCNLVLQAGWNKYVEESVALDGYSVTYDVYVNEPVGLKWYYSSY